MKSHKNDTAIFLEISVYLTGFSELELLGTGMLETYFNVMMNKNTIDTVEHFLLEAAKVIKQNRDPEQLSEAILTKLMRSSLYGGLAKNIITMWYMGNWMNEVISPQSYVQGLIWNTASSHPPGAKQPGYGSWNKAPKQFDTI